MDKVKNYYCPICKKYGKDKLLLQGQDLDGIIIIKCRGCKNLIRLKLNREPLSRE